MLHVPHKTFTVMGNLHVYVKASGGHFLGSRDFLSSHLGQIHCRKSASNLYPPSRQAGYGCFPAMQNQDRVSRRLQWGNLTDSSCLYGKYGLRSIKCHAVKLLLRIVTHQC